LVLSLRQAGQPVWAIPPSANSSAPALKFGAGKRTGQVRQDADPADVLLLGFLWRLSFRAGQRGTSGTSGTSGTHA